MGMSEIAPHEPHEPFIRLVTTKLGDVQTTRAYCTLCQRRVRLKFGNFVEKDEKPRWVHIDEDPGNR
jgi:hypothetical protein